MENSATTLVDILEPRRNEISTWLWTTRALNLKYAYVREGVPKPTPLSHKLEVLNSAIIQDLLDKVSVQQDVPKKILEQQVKEILDEIGYERSYKLIRWLGLVLCKICLRINSGICVNESEILNMRKMMGNCPVIFVPSHRSYGDFILMSLLCFNYDIAIPEIAAGMDFHGMLGMGSVLRHTGAFFMRRSYNDDGLYWTTFKQYVYQLVTKGDLPIEFFIEGTRSRTGKSLTPKFGLLLMILKAYFLSQVPDILIVPINITYDRVLEETLFSYELLGVPKPKESTSGFFKSLKIVQDLYGKIYFGFSKPISVKEYFADKLKPPLHNIPPLQYQEVTDYEKSLLPNLAHRIVYEQQKQCVITTFNLISISVLIESFKRATCTIDLGRLTQEVKWLKDIFIKFGARVDCNNIETDIIDALQVHANLLNVVNNCVSLASNEIVLDKYDKKKLKGHGFSNKTMTYSVPFVLLQLYVNPTMHYLINASIIVTVLRSNQSLFNNGSYQFLRTVLTNEFVVYEPNEEAEFDKALKILEQLGVILGNDGGGFSLGSNVKLADVLFNLLAPFVYSYFILVSVLIQKANKLTTEKEILTTAQKCLEDKLISDTGFLHPYCFNLDTLGNCLNYLTTSRAVRRSRTNGIVSYEVDENCIKTLLNKLEPFVSEVFYNNYSKYGQIDNGMKHKL